MTTPADVLERTGYRLPTEAEWEYACRSGTTTARYHGASIELLGAYAHDQANSRQHAWPAADLLPNDLGLFDMLGNVSEWAHDAFGPGRPIRHELNYDNINILTYIIGKDHRNIRGGSFNSYPAVDRSAFRGWFAPGEGSFNGGFRPSRTY
jgi:formylglycine-generating enzyme required for sulfatase activity